MGGYGRSWYANGVGGGHRVSDQGRHLVPFHNEETVAQGIVPHKANTMLRIAMQLQSNADFMGDSLNAAGSSGPGYKIE
jgi:hypothetical protein